MILPTVIHFNVCEAYFWIYIKRFERFRNRSRDDNRDLGNRWHCVVFNFYYRPILAHSSTALSTDFVEKISY